MKSNCYRCLLSLFLVLNFSSHAQVYDSLNISLLSTWNDPAVPAEPFYGIRYNGIWGWDDGNGNEYAIIGATSGVYFINVTNPQSPVQADFVPGRRDSCIWREIKTYSHYAYLVSDDQSPNSFQIVDLQYLPDSVSVVYDGNGIFERAHTLFVDGQHLYCGIVKGGQFQNTAAMAVFSLANPVQPVLLRKLNTDFPGLLSNNQVHDMYARNDTVYASCAYDGLFIFKYDSVANSFSLASSLTSYPQQGYNHSSALTDDGSTLVFMDEVPNGLAVKVLDVSDFSNLTIKSTFKSNTGPTPHNPFMVGNTCYIAYYQDGLQVYDVSDPVNPARIGYFDTHYQTAMGGPYPSPAYQGAWGAYPYLPSGNILVSDMQNGLFVLDPSPMFASVEENNTAVAFSLFPNPASADETCTIRLLNQTPVDGILYIRDVQGRLISSRNYKATTITFSVRDLSSGLYTVEWRTQSGAAVKKLLVR